MSTSELNVVHCCIRNGTPSVKWEYWTNVCGKKGVCCGEGGALPTSAYCQKKVIIICTIGSKHYVTISIARAVWVVLLQVKATEFIM